MSATILEVLQNAEHNIVNNKRIPPAVEMGERQLHNAIILLEKGYLPHECFDDVVGGCEDVENVPGAPEPK